MKDLLGNVKLTFSDVKLVPFNLDLMSVSNYYPYGMLQPNNYWSAPGRGCRFGYNGS